jgi:hypothetical protein
MAVFEKIMLFTWQALPGQSYSCGPAFRSFKQAFLYVTGTLVTSTELCHQ